MTSIVPNLDDRTFEQLVEEARGLIPEIAPEWTDHNVHDPGISVIELLGFLVEQQIYRVGFVGPSMREAFTRLMGIAPRAAEPARFDIWPIPGIAAPALDLADRFALTTRDLPDAQFMLDGDTRLVDAEVINLRRQNADGSVKPLGNGLIERRSPLLVRATQAGGPSALLFDIVGPIASLGGGPISLGIVVESAPVGAAKWGPVVLEQGVDSAWQELELLDTTAGLTRSGTLRFRPIEGSGKTTFRIRFDTGFRPGAVTLTALGLNVLSVVEGWDEAASVIGTEVKEGNGIPGQILGFESHNIVGGLDALTISGPGDTAGTTKEWKIVETFEASGPQDSHMTLDPEAGTLTVGNGVNGRLLPFGERLRHAAFARTSGAAGNITKGLRWHLQDVLFGENIAPGQGGRDADKLDDLIMRARQVASARSAHLSAHAIKEHLQRVGLGLGRIEVLSQQRPGAAAKGSRTVWIIPDRDPLQRPQAIPRLDVIDAVESALQPARLLGERIYVSTPIYLDVDIELTVLVERDADARAVRAMLQSLVESRVWDLERHSEVAPWNPGQSLGPGDIRALVAQVPEVLRVEHCSVRADDGRALTEDGSLTLSKRECPLLRDLNLKVRLETGGVP